MALSMRSCSDLLAQPPQFLLDRLPFDVALGDRVLLDLTGPPVKKIRPDTQVVGDLRDRPRAAVAHHPHRIAPEFFRVLLPLLRHGPDSGSIVAPFGVRKIGSTPLVYTVHLPNKEQIM